MIRHARKIPEACLARGPAECRAGEAAAVAVGSRLLTPSAVIPAKAGTQLSVHVAVARSWAPAFAGVTASSGVDEDASPRDPGKA